MSAEAAAIGARPGALSSWLMAARPRTLSAGFVPVAVGSALAYSAGCFNLPVATATLAAALLIQIGTNLANDYYDFVGGADTEARLGPLRVTQAGLIAPRTVRNAALATLGAAAAVGCYLVAVGGWPIFAIGIVSLAAAMAYSAGPYPLAHNGLGDAFVFVFFGVLAVSGTVFLQCGHLWPMAVASSIPVACLATAILAVNNLRDTQTDRSAGKRTLAVRFGPDFVRSEYVALVAVAFFAALVMAMMAGARFLLPLCAIPMAFREARAVLRCSGAALNRSLAGTAALHMAYGLLLAVAIVT
jgi:1,4-dihydroxy-2-naphthoate octaprenyltransferase